MGVGVMGIECYYRAKRGIAISIHADFLIAAGDVVSSG